MRAQAGVRARSPVGQLGGEELEEAVRVGAGVLQHEVVEAGVDELLRHLDVAGDVRAAGELLRDVLGRTVADAASKLTGLGSSLITFQPVSAQRVVSSAAWTPACSSGAQASGTSAYAARSRPRR